MPFGKRKIQRERDETVRICKNVVKHTNYIVKTVESNLGKGNILYDVKGLFKY